MFIWNDILKIELSYIRENVDIIFILNLFYSLKFIMKINKKIIIIKIVINILDIVMY